MLPRKALWVKKGRPGGFCQEGLWGFSRHPNYFGEIFQWWFAWALAYHSSEAARGYLDPLWWACAISPIFTMLILLHLKPTGIYNAEGKNLKRYYDQCPDEYGKYRESTSILIPMIGYQYGGYPAQKKGLMSRLFGSKQKHIVEIPPGTSMLGQDLSKRGDTWYEQELARLGKDGIRCTKVGTNGKPYERFAGAQWEQLKEGREG
eukprot:g10131.t1